MENEETLSTFSKAQLPGSKWGWRRGTWYLRGGGEHSTKAAVGALLLDLEVRFQVRQGVFAASHRDGRAIGLWAGTPDPSLSQPFTSAGLLPSLGGFCVFFFFFFSFSWHQYALNSEIFQFPFFFLSAPCPPRALSLSGSTTCSDGTVMLSLQAGPQSHLRARDAGKCGPGLRRCKPVVGMKASISATVRTVLLHHLYCHSSCVRPSLGDQLLEVSAVTCSSLLFQHHFLHVFYTHTQFTDTVLAKTLDLSEYHFAQQVCGSIRVKNWVS